MALYFEGSEYRGPKGACSMCERHFKIGELIFVDSSGSLLFCAKKVVLDEDGQPKEIPCCVKWSLENSQGCSLIAVIFRGKV